MILKPTIRAKMESGSRLPTNCAFRAYLVISTNVIQVFKLHVTRRYWDWAEKDVEENGIPPVLIDNLVEIMAAGGKTQIVNNPLSYFPYVGEIPPDFTDETNSEVKFISFLQIRETRSRVVGRQKKRRISPSGGGLTATPLVIRILEIVKLTYCNSM
jgi:hypothetical protein